MEYYLLAIYDDLNLHEGSFGSQFIFKLIGIVFFIQVIQTVCELLSNNSAYEKRFINES